ncbi:MAG: hypothetical protein HQL27_04460 [Candidatus Omnitrophica bacterium]|nr:hypothetical protein [Candidatus Omnitrophota bacterium]
MNKQKTFSLILLIIISLFLFIPNIDYLGLLSTNGFDGLLATGDLGRDFYAFERTLHGELPYKDYWWVYGPAMPFYYAAFFKLFGVNIISALLGKTLLLLACGIVFYLILAEIIPASYAILGAIWFYLFGGDFFFTFNHIGGIFGLLVTALCIALYFTRGERKYHISAIAAIFLLFLIKLNFGFTSLITWTVSCGLSDYLFRKEDFKKNLIFYLISGGIIITLAGFAYFLLLQNLTMHEIRQCLPYLKADSPYHVSPLKALSILIKPLFADVFSKIVNIIISCGLLLLAARAFLNMKKESGGKLLQNKKFLFILSMAFFALINLHEFLKSGVYYRTYWSKPFCLLLMFLFIYFGSAKLPKIFKLAIYFYLVCFLALSTFFRFKEISLIKTPEHYLPVDRAKVFIKNSPDWVKAVSQTALFINYNIKDKEQFFTAPYDPLYYFLSGKKAPDRQLIFFDHINIRKEQEEKIIGALKQNNIKWVILSNRIVSYEPGMGVFGKTNSVVLGKYIEDNFGQVASFGDWIANGGWGWDHSTIALKRSDTLNEQK